METNIEFIDFNREEIPASKIVDIDGKMYEIEIQYNELGDYYSLILYDENGLLLMTSKLVYMYDALSATVEGLPSKKIVPLNFTDYISGKYQDIQVNRENFGEKVSLCLI